MVNRKKEAADILRRVAERAAASLNANDCCSAPLSYCLGLLSLMLLDSMKDLRGHCSPSCCHADPSDKVDQVKLRNGEVEIIIIPRNQKSRDPLKPKSRDPKTKCKQRKENR
ncbi:hypothetical protein IEQ34_003159 [Dendrobium chrysotoxum]|uniref:Uncharacterized protein n=1 Tax=Dendrobium chrysotoxum TaxID=161865 RepID=A0AAV7HHX3_DENCH|nr:hypothetical protein IEQ34_003159 [Dendrobium chrysotoxum]